MIDTRQFKIQSLMVMILFLFAMPLHAKQVIRFSTVAPAHTPWSDTLEFLKRKVDSETRGELQMKVYLGGQLGGELDILKAIQTGKLEGGGITTASLAKVVPELELLELPYLFNSNEECDYILDEVVFESYKKLLDQKGLVLILWSENGWRSIGSKSKAIHVPADLKDLKVRSQESKVHMAFWKRFAAIPKPIAVNQVLTALQSGAVDGFDNTALFTLAAEWNNSIQHFSTTEHIYQPGAIVYNKKLFSKLHPSEQKLILESGKELTLKSRVAVRTLNQELMNLLKNSGISILTLSETEKDAFRQAVKGLDLELVKAIGGKSQDIFNQIQAGKAEFLKNRKK